MKMLFDVANHISLTNIQRQNNNSNQSNELVDNKNCSVIDKLVLIKEK